MPDRARNRAVRELADHLEDLCQEALARGATDDEAREYVETKLGETADTAVEVLTAARESLASRVSRCAEAHEDSLRGSNDLYAAAADRLRALRLAVRSAQAVSPSSASYEPGWLAAPQPLPITPAPAAAESESQ